MSELSFPLRLPKVLTRHIATEADLRWAAKAMGCTIEDGQVIHTTYQSGYGDTVDVRRHVMGYVKLGTWMVWIENQDPHNADFLPYEDKPLTALDLPKSLLRNITPMFG